MAGLVLKLAPKERILVNGVVMENGPNRTRLTICSSGASVLRLRDAIHPDDVVGPVSRAYYCAQLCVAGEAEDSVAAQELNQRLRELEAVFDDTAAVAHLAEARAQLRLRNFYQVMRALKPLIPLEQELLPAAPAAPQPVEERGAL